MQQGRPAPSYSDRGQANAPGVDPGLLSQLLDRVSTLEEQVRQLRGRVDELANTQQQQAADFTKQLGDLQFAMQNSGGRPPSGASAQPSYQSPPSSMLGVPGLGGTTASAPPGPAAPPLRTPELALGEANAALARRDYPAAAAAAREVLAKRGPRAADAHFVLAQAELGHADV